MTTTVDSTPRSLHKKLAEVMLEAERIPKNGTAPQAMGGFKFVQVGDAADFIRKALGKRNVSMLPTLVEIVGQNEHATKSGGTMTTVELRITWTLTDGESGESASFQSYGVGADTGDKYSGKATTTAMKYALLSGWQLSTGEDIEQTDTSDRAARQPARSSGDGQEWERPLGEITRSGAIARGSGMGYKLEAREGPDGHSIGFRLELGDDKHIPQVLAKGPLGEALYLATSMKPETLYGEKATVTGELLEVGQAGRKAYHRLVLTRIETKDFTLPRDEPNEPPTIPAFSDADLAAAGIE